MSDEATFMWQEKFWMVVNVAECVENKWGNAVLPPHRRPSYIHESREEAEAEALRLHRLGGRFVVVESVAFTKSRKNWVITEPEQVTFLESFDQPLPDFRRKKKPIRKVVQKLPSQALEEGRAA